MSQLPSLITNDGRGIAAQEELLKLIDELQLVELFEQVDKFGIEDAELEGLRADFIANRVNENFANTLTEIDIDWKWHEIGMRYDELGQYEKAIESYQKAIAIKLENDSAWNNLGLAYANLENYEKAIESYQKAIEINPIDSSPFYNLACVFCLQKDKSQALTYLQQAIALNPEEKESAKTDTDFEWLWEDADFKVLVGK